MKRTIYILLLLVLLGISQAYAARVNNVELSYRDGNTVAKIFVEGKVRFVHQTEEAKDGKPYRVIVDVLSATHQLGQMNFTQLPNCLVQGIRSSQYSVSPEQIVRVVFDLKETSIYRVDSDNESISVFFQDKKATPFTTWSSSKVSAPDVKKPAENKAVKTPPTVAKADTRVSAVPGAKASTAKEPVTSQTAVKKEQSATPKVTANAEAKKTVVAQNTPAQKPAVKQATKPPVKTNKEQSPVKASNQPVKKESTKQYATVPKTQASKKTSKSSPVVAKAKPKQTPKAPPAKTKNENKVTSDNNKTGSKPAAQPKVKNKKEKSKSTTTSRFRRSPTSPTKIKGTLVAEFPKRLVVKYKARSYRDPFATLIDDTRSYQGPVAERMPNVEGLKLVGIIEATGDSNRALFEDKEGYSYILKSGDKVKKGYVLRVESDRVYFQIFEYGWSRTVALKIVEY